MSRPTRDGAKNTGEFRKKATVGYLSEDEARKVLRCYQRPIAQFIHAQMQTHYWEETGGSYEVKVSKGYTELKPKLIHLSGQRAARRLPGRARDRSNMAKYLFGGFDRCLYPVQKFDPDAERRLAAILERDVIKWFKPTRGQFQIYYHGGAEHLEYQPDFVAETSDTVSMIEPKASNQMDDPIVLAKQDAAVNWCIHATDHALNNGGKPWRYVLIPHDEIASNITLTGLAARFRGTATD